MSTAHHIETAARHYQQATARHEAAKAAYKANKNPRKENDLASDLHYSEEHMDRTFGTLYRLVKAAPGWELRNGVPRQKKPAKAKR